jgi:hypothetical protein
MKQNKGITVAIFLLIILGLYMIYLGFYSGPKTLIPPIVTGVGFFVIAAALNALKK